MIRTRSSIGLLAEDHLGTDGQGEPGVVAHRTSTFSTGTGAPVLTDSMDESARPSARRASLPVTDGGPALADRVRELDELGDVGVAEELDVPADGVDVATRAGGVRRARTWRRRPWTPCRRSEDLAADVVPVGGGEAGLGDGDGAVVEGDRPRPRCRAVRCRGTPAPRARRRWRRRSRGSAPGFSHSRVSKSWMRVWRKIVHGGTPAGSARPGSRVSERISCGVPTPPSATNRWPAAKSAEKRRLKPTCNATPARLGGRPAAVDLLEGEAHGLLAEDRLACRPRRRRSGRRGPRRRR